MGAILGFLQIIAGAAGDDLFLEGNVILQHFLQGKNAGHAVYQRQHNHTEGHLHLRHLVQVIEHHLGVGVPLDGDLNVHTLAGGEVLNVRHALDLLVSGQLGNAGDQRRLAHLVGQFGNHDLVAVTLALYNLCPGTQIDLAPAGLIGLANAPSAHNDTGGGEVRTFNVLHQLRQSGIRVVDQATHTVNHFPQIVGRNVGGHTYGDAAGAVHQQIGIAGRQHLRLFQSVIVVGGKIHRILVNILQHFHADLAHSALGVSVRSGRITVYGTKVAVTVYQRVAHGEGLGQSHHGIIHRCIAVGVVTTQHGTYGVCTLSVRPIRVQVVLKHGVENTAVYRLQPVPHIRQGTADDHAHRVVQKGLAHLFVNLYIYDLLIVIPDLIVIHWHSSPKYGPQPGRFYLVNL